MEASFIHLIEQIFRNDMLSEEDKKKLIEKIESDAVSAYMRKIDASLALNQGTLDGPLIAAALKMHYDLIMKTMNEPSKAYTQNLTERLAGKIKYVNITIDLDALRKSIDPNFNIDSPDDSPNDQNN